MPPPLHREKTGAAAARLGLTARMLVVGVILALGPGSAALAERAARAAGPASPVPTPRGPGPPEARSAVGAARGQEWVPPLRMPLAGSIVRGFEASAGTYGPGLRGVDVGGRVGEAVRAPAGGRVEFAGPVAGVTWVSLLVAPGVTVTVGPLLDAQVAAGQRVRALAPVGRLGPGHGPALGPGHGPALGPGHQPAHVPAYGMALHLGLRVDGVYVDPLPYLLDRPRPRLAPLLRPGGLAGPAPGRPTTG
jgi:murein DD-endopeptidase MepM/ murein hydrolase activator NlpD